MRKGEFRRVILNCQTCSQDFWVHASRIKRGNAKYCSTHCARVGPAHPNWKQGRTKTRGYMRVWCPDHPNARNNYVLEHVLIAEKALGHWLPEEACVHHVNEIKSDNQNFNLVICQDHAYHMALHQRQRVLRAGGNPDTDKICSKCQRVQSLTNFSTCGPFRHVSYCRPCRRIQ